MQLPGKRGKKINIFGPGHMTKMAAIPIYAKNLKNLLLQNHLANFLETEYEAFGELVIVYINNDAGLTMTHFMARSNLVP